MTEHGKNLPDQPMVWSDWLPDGHRQRWAPGAFDVPDISDVVSFRVHEDVWRKTESGWERTILRAEIVRTSL